MRHVILAAVLAFSTLAFAPAPAAANNIKLSPDYKAKIQAAIARYNALKAQHADLVRRSQLTRILATKRALELQARLTAEMVRQALSVVVNLSSSHSR